MSPHEILQYVVFGFTVFILGVVSAWLIFRKILQHKSESRTGRLRTERIKVVFSLGACVVFWSLYGFNFCQLLIPVALTAFTLGISVFILMISPSNPPQTMTKETKDFRSAFWNLLTRLLYFVIGGLLGAIIGWLFWWSADPSFSAKTAEMIVGSFFALTGLFFGKRVFGVLVRCFSYAP